MDEAVTRKDLRVFGLGVGAILGGIGTLALLAWWPFAETHPRLGGGLAGVGAGLFALGAVAPAALRPVRAVWMRVVAPIAWFNTRLLLGLVYYGIVWPTGVLRRLRRDPLARGGPARESYWIAKEPAAGLESYRRQT